MYNTSTRVNVHVHSCSRALLFSCTRVLVHLNYYFYLIYHTFITLTPSLPQTLKLSHLTPKCSHTLPCSPFLSHVLLNLSPSYPTRSPQTLTLSLYILLTPQPICPLVSLLTVSPQSLHPHSPTFTHSCGDPPLSLNPSPH